MITSLLELSSHFPSIKMNMTHEWHSPCPMCLEDKTEIEFQGIKFYGEDRLVWFLASQSFYCRRCAGNGLGRNQNGFYTLLDITNTLGLSVADGMEIGEVKLEEEPFVFLWDDYLVEKAHERVDKAYWARFGWTNEIITKFKLGYATFIREDGPAHIIPMQLERVIKVNDDDVMGKMDKFYIAARQEGGRPKRNRGSVRSYWWRIKGNNDECKTVVLAEGEKDGITASLLFPEYDIVVVFGAMTWNKAKTQVLKSLGYTSIIALGDNDMAGLDMNKRIAESALALGMECTELDWGKIEFEVASGYDITDLNGRFPQLARQLIVDSLIKREVSTSLVESNYHVTGLPDSSSNRVYTTLDALRNGDNSIYKQVEKYLEDEDTNDILVLKPPPGAGKSFAIVKKSMEVAKASLEKSMVELARLKEREASLSEQYKNGAELSQDDLEAVGNMLRSVRKQIGEFSFANIAWYGQYRDGYKDLLANGMDEELCYDYQARNIDNCKNIDLVNRLGANNHNIGEYCALGCPFRDSCKESGYLSQEEKRKSKPITFFRHQHMLSSMAREYYVNVIDESPTHILDGEAMAITPNDLVPHNAGWELDIVDRLSVEYIDILVRALRMVCAYNTNEPPRLDNGEDNPKYFISGNKLIDILNTTIKSISNELDIVELFNGINSRVLNKYHPVFVSGEKSQIKKRCITELYGAILREIPSYLENNDILTPTCIHLVGGTLEILPIKKLTIPSKSKIVIADATGMSEMYLAMIGRPTRVFEPLVRNENAVIIVVEGSDYTKGHVNSDLGTHIVANKRAKSKVVTLLGDEVELSVPVDIENFNSRIIKDIKTLLDYVSKEHSRVLVVTYKDLKELVEKLFPIPNISYAHYGALRGSNVYKDYEAVCLIGAYRVPYDVVWRKIQFWASMLGIKDEIPKKTILKVANYDGTTQGHTYRTFDHWFADKYVNMIETGEMIQSAERIRPHASSDKKYVYILASRPALLYTSKVISKTKFLNSVNPMSKRAVIKNALLKQLEEEYAKSGIVMLPSYRALAVEHKVSFSTIKVLRNEAIEVFSKRVGVASEQDLTVTLEDTPDQSTINNLQPNKEEYQLI